VNEEAGSEITSPGSSTRVAIEPSALLSFALKVSVIASGVSLMILQPVRSTMSASMRVMTPCQTDLNLSIPTILFRDSLSYIFFTVSCLRKASTASTTHTGIISLFYR